MVYHLKRELKGHMCLCEKNLAMECDREKKSNMFNWHEKKNMHKKIAQPSPQKFNGLSLTIVFCNLRRPSQSILAILEVFGILWYSCLERDEDLKCSTQ